MNKPDLTHTLPPSDLLMPAVPQVVTTLVYATGAMIFVIYASRMARQHKSMIPVYLILGSLATLYLEPVVDLLGNAVHPQINQWNIITTNGHPVPIAVLVGYIWYFAALPLLCLSHFENRSLTQRFVWKCFAGVVISAAVVEQIPLYFGVWEYYGYQPFKIGFIPAWWCFANTAAVIVPFLIIYGLYPKLTGAKSVAVVALLPSGAFMGHAASGWPMYNALGTDTESFPEWILQASSGASILLSLFVVWTLMALIDLPKSTSKPNFS